MTCDSRTPTDSAAERPAYTASDREVYVWAAGGLASHALIGMFGKVGEVFTIWLGMSPVLIGWAMAIPRLVDALVSPRLGHWSDHARTRWGRRRPFLVVAGCVGAVSLSAIWWPVAWSPTARFIHLIATGTLLYCCYGLYTTAWSALGCELTDDYHERTRVAALDLVAATVISLAVGWMNWIALRPVFGGVIQGFRWIAAVMGLLVIASALGVAGACRVRFADGSRRPYPFWASVRAALALPPFRMLVAFRFCQVFGERVFLGLLLFVGIAYVCQGDQSRATMYVGYGTTAGSILGLLLAPAIKRVSQAIGKRRGLITAATISLGLAVALPFILTPAHPLSLAVPLVIALPLILFTGSMSSAIIPDICDLDELTHGQRREGLFTALLGTVQKLELSLTVVAMMYLVSWSGYDVRRVAQDVPVQRTLLWFMSAPYVLFAGLSLWCALRFPLTAESMREVTRQLAQRRRDRSLASGEPEQPSPR